MGREAGGKEGLAEVVRRQGGVVSRGQALRFVASSWIERRLRSGRWQAPHRGVYVTHSGPLDAHQRRWVATLAVGDGQAALLGGLSALETLGFRPLRMLEDARVHVLVPARTTVRRPPPGVVVHRSSRVPPADIHRMGRPPGTMPARSLIDAAQWCADDDRARAVIAAGFQQRLVGAVDLEPVLARMPRAHRRGLIVEALRDAAAGAHSVPEAAFLRLCRRARLPVPVMQHRRRDARGRLRHLDGYFEDWGVHVEIDGGQHTDAAEWWADMHRQNALWIPGDRILRFPTWAIRHHPAEVSTQLTQALRAAGWRGPA